MKFNVNIKKGISVTLVFEGENIDNKVLEYVKEKELFTGKSGEIYSYLPFDGEKQILVGLGKKEELKEDEVREVFFKVVKVLLTNKELEAQIEIPNLDRIGKNTFVKALVEGALHATYKFDKYKSDRKELPEIIINIITVENVEESIKEAEVIMDSIFFARDLVNERAEYLYPETLANIAKSELTPLGVEVEVYDEKQCEEL